MDYIGISEDKAKHCLGVARECYRLAKERGYDEDFCRRMFMVGWNHDVGYEFVTDTREHPKVSEEMLCSLGVQDKKVMHAIRTHGHVSEVHSIEYYILNQADLTVDSQGNKVDVVTRLRDIEKRYGCLSEQAKNAWAMAFELGLVVK